MTLNNAKSTNIQYIAGSDFNITQITADGKEYKGSGRWGAGKIMYTIFFSNNTMCNLIWEENEWDTTIKAQECTTEMLNAIKNYVRLQPTTVDIQVDNCNGDERKINNIKSIIKKININTIKT